MALHLTPYLSFEGNAREAMDFYQGIFGGELTRSTYGEFGQAGTPIAELIMHSQLVTPTGLTLMGADSAPGMERKAGNSVSITLHGDEADKLRAFWDGLVDGAEVAVPLEKQMWGDEFGMCTDRFGVIWQVNINQPQP